MNNQTNMGVPAIIRPTREIMTTGNIRISGRFEVELIHKPTGLVKRQLKFNNLITNAGLNPIGNGTTLGSLRGGAMRVGSGNNPPAVTDTALQTPVGAASSTAGPNNGTIVSNNVDWWKEYTNQKVFGSGISTGILSEVGVFNGSTMWTRQLFKDEFGNPTTIDKQADDELRITYISRINFMSTPQVQTVMIKGIETTVSTRGYNFNGPNGGWGDALGRLGSVERLDGDTFAYETNTMPAFTATQTGTRVAPALLNGWSTYIDNSFYRDVTVGWNPASNIPNIGSIVWGGYAFSGPLSSFLFSSPWITTFSPTVSKSEVERVIFTGRVSWGRAE